MTDRCLFLVLLLAAGGPSAQDAAEASGIQGGLVVHVGCGDGESTARLRVNDRYLVHGLDADPENVEKARRRLRSQGLYGPVSVDRFDGARLPYADNLVNLVVVSDAACRVPAEEILRVLAPRGAAVLPAGFEPAWPAGVRPEPAGKGRIVRKPVPSDIDEWPQYLRGADNNAVARDAVAGPPRRLQWVTDPSWSRSHMAIPTVVGMVSAGGRLFTIEDAATPEHPFLPERFALVARDAFNGIALWRHAFPDWEPVTRYVKDIAVQLQRRLAAAGDVVYDTPGLNAPLTAFDAATGKVLRTYAGTERTQEFAIEGGVIYAVIGDRMNAAQYNIVKTYSGKGTSLGGSDPKAPFDGTGFRGAYSPETPDKAESVCAIAALDLESGRSLWKIEGIRGYTGCSLAVRGARAVYQTAGGLTCVDPKTGRKVWSVEKAVQGGDGTEANTVILSDAMVYAQEGRKLCAYSLKDGAEKWTAPIAGNYEKSADLFLAAGAVWTGGTQQPASYDPETGQKRGALSQRMTGPMSHDRCYRNFITERFYINSKTGGADFLELATGKEFPHYWTRGTCGMGVLPCNGLLYAPPYSCQCSIQAMVHGFNAYASEKGLESPAQPIRVEQKARLEKGPAFGQVPKPKAEEDGAWPTYRHDGSRGGASASKVPSRLKPAWKAQLRTIPSAPVIAERKVFVSDIEGYTLCALDASDGRPVWEYVAGSRVDSPPTYHEGLLLFGSRDGWVHCLRASDGALAWRFKDLPDRLVGAFGRLESAWPVCGSVLVQNGVAYFAAGRSSFLDGGIFVYGLDPRTGEVKHRRQVYGPFDGKTGFPATDHRAFRADVPVSDGKLLYFRHRAFTLDLEDAGSPAAHVLPSAGFLDGTPQHRTYWTWRPAFVGTTELSPPSGDILVTDGKEYYEMRGFPVHRHSYFDPRVKGYRLAAGSLGGGAPSGGGRKKGKGEGADEKWSVDLPLTGKAMALAGDVVFIAGTPAHFPPGHGVEKYEESYAGRLGGVLWAASAADGKKLSEQKLEAAPCWDGLAAAGGRLYLSTRDGRVTCFAGE